MSGDRARRAERVVELRKKAVELAQTACARAILASVEAEALAKAAEDEWGRASVATTEASSTSDLAEQSAWIRSLRVRADRAAWRSFEVRREVERAQSALASARAEHRRIELWRDGLVAAERATLARKERVAADEVAARTARRQT